MFVYASYLYFVLVLNIYWAKNVFFQILIDASCCCTNVNFKFDTNALLWMYLYKRLLGTLSTKLMETDFVGLWRDNCFVPRHSTNGNLFLCVEKLLKRHLPPVIVWILIYVYKGQEAWVRWGPLRSETFRISNGTHQV